MANKKDLGALLQANTYPGRGVLIGRSEGGEHMAIAYFIMGRSENSCNRVFVEEGDGIRTQAFDPAKLVDPSLVIYAPVRVKGGVTVVTNGDQTDTVYDALDGGCPFDAFERALCTRTFEPDPPIYTPRVSGVVWGGEYALSILKSQDGDPAVTLRQFFRYTAVTPGTGHLIHTYQCDGNPPLSFAGEPVCVAVRGDLDTFTKEVWENLNPEKRVSLFTRFIDLRSGTFETRITNRNV